MRYNCVVLKLQKKIFSVPIDLGEVLINKLIDECLRFDLFYYFWIVHFDCLDSARLGEKAGLFKEPTYCLDFR